MYLSACMPPSRRLSPAMLVTCLLSALLHAPAADSSPAVPRLEKSVTEAEGQLAVGFYTEAAATARQVLKETTPTDPTRGRALTVLGKVLFFTSRVRLRGEDDSEATQGRRKAGMELAERAFRGAIPLGGPSAAEARLYLADLLLATDRIAEAREAFDEYLRESDPEARPPHAGHIRECLEFWRTHDGTPILDPGEGRLQLPERIRAPMPRSTRAARFGGLSGVVVAQLLIDRDGRVACVKPLLGLPMGMTEATLEALQDWVYRPARMDGSAVPLYGAVTVKFPLEPMRP